MDPYIVAAILTRPRDYEVAIERLWQNIYRNLLRQVCEQHTNGGVNRNHSLIY